MEIISSFGIHKIMYHNSKNENDKILQFHLNNSCYVETKPPFTKCLPPRNVTPLTLKIKQDPGWDACLRK